MRISCRYFYKLSIFLLFFCISGILPDKVFAAEYKQEEFVTVTDRKVGRYKINYTGNTNHYTDWFDTGSARSQYIYRDLGGAYINSSSASISPINPNAEIKYAYLIWESRTSEKEGFALVDRPVRFLLPNGSGHSIYPDSIIRDNRDNWDGMNHTNYASMTTMVADVTEHVKGAGYGTYSVCNIPMWQPTLSNRNEQGHWPGGDSPGSWQLIIIEEDDDYEVSVVSLFVNNQFYLAENFGCQYWLPFGIKTATTGTPKGQFLFGAIVSLTDFDFTEYIVLYQDDKLLDKSRANRFASPGLYKDGVLVNRRDNATGGMLVDLSSDISLANGANQVRPYVSNGQSWTSFTMLGTNLEIAYPDFAGTQTTTVTADATGATVTGRFKNMSTSTDTGIYDGNLTIELDPQLTATSATATVNGQTIPAGRINMNGNIVTFSGATGDRICNIKKGDIISYTVNCTASTRGALEYKNHAYFNGYLRADGVNTGYWIEKMWTAHSEWERTVYKVTLNHQGAYSAGTGQYFEWYDHGNYTTANCLQAISTITQPYKANHTFEGYWTTPATWTSSNTWSAAGTKYVNGQHDSSVNKILSGATTFTSNTTLYARYQPNTYRITLDNRGATDSGSRAYFVEYGIGNYLWYDSSTNRVSGAATHITRPTKAGYTFAGYWTKPDPNGNGIGTDAPGNVVCVDADGKITNTSTYFKGDTTLYAYWIPNEYTISLNSDGANFHGSTYFNEKVGKAFYYSKTVTESTTTTLTYHCTGGEQTFIAPYTGNYVLDVWGAPGSSAFAAGGAGGHSTGTVWLNQGETLYIYVGGQGSGLYGGYNGGSNGGEWGDWWSTGGGGGGTDIRRGGNGIDNRILVAGGGGGSARAKNIGGWYYTLPGGNGGNWDYLAFNVALGNGDPMNPLFSDTVWSYDPRSTISYNAAQKHTASGAGGGGGYEGGRAIWNMTAISAGEGGTSYGGGVTNYTYESGVSAGAGCAYITYYNVRYEYTETTRIEPPVMMGYQFCGYFTLTNGWGTQVTDRYGNIIVPNTYFTADTTVYAHWIPDGQDIPNRYAIKYDGNGAVAGSIQPQTNLSYGSWFQLAANGFIRDGYIFTGYAVIRTSDYHVFCNGYGWQPMGSSAASNPANWRIYQPGEAFILDEAWINPSAADDTFLFCAQWRRPTYTIRYNGNNTNPNIPGDAINGTMAGHTGVGYGSSFTVRNNAYTRTGFTYAGFILQRRSDGKLYYVSPHNWDINPSPYQTRKYYGGNVITMNDTIVRSDVGDDEFWLWAQWTANTYIIRFHANGGSGSMADVTCTYGQYVSLPVNAFTKPGSQFKKWNTSPDGTGTSYTGGASVINLTSTPGGVIDLYAQWNDVTPPIIADDGNTLPESPPTPGSGGTGHDDVYYVEYPWVNHSVRLNYSATDNVAVSSVTLYSSSGAVLNSGRNRATYTVTTEGITTYKVVAKDTSGNTTTWHIKVKIDYVAPYATCNAFYDGYNLTAELKNIVEPLSGCKEAWIVTKAYKEDGTKIREDVRGLTPQTPDNIHTGAAYKTTILLEDDYNYVSAYMTVEYHIKDIAGNERTLADTDTFDTFYLTGTLTRIFGPAAVWKAGEAGALDLATGVFVDTMAITYPAPWTALDASLGTHTFDYMANREQEKTEYETFIIPLKTDDGDYSIMVTATKNGHTKTIPLSLRVGGNIIDTIRTRIKYSPDDYPIYRDD